MLFALGIEGVGYITGRNLAQRFRSIDALLAATPEQIADTPGIGPKVAELIGGQLQDPQMREQIDALRPFVRFEVEGPPPGEGPLAGKTFVLTGTLPDLTREEATERILAAGGKVTSVGLEEDGLRRRGRLAGLQAREGRAPRRDRARRARAARAPGRVVSRAMAEDSLYVVVEIPKGSSNKYEWDDELGAIKLDRLLFSSLGYPTDYGFFRDTLAADGDPLDAMVVVSEPTFPGCCIEVKPVALFRMRDENAEDNKILCVPLTDPNWSHIEKLEDLPMSAARRDLALLLDLQDARLEGRQGRRLVPARGGAGVDRAAPAGASRTRQGE